MSTLLTTATRLPVPRFAHARALAHALAPTLSPSRRLSSSSAFPRRTKRLLPHIDPTKLAHKKSAEEAVNNILYNTPLISQSSSRRVLSCLVTNEPGVLSRVSGILAGRGYNIDSLVVSETDVHDLSRMTVVLNAPQTVVDQVRRQLEDLVPVWAVLDYTDVSMIERELLLIKVSLLPQDRPHVEGAHTEDDAPQHVATVRDGDIHTSKLPHMDMFGPDFQRQALTQVATLFGGRVVDLTLDCMTIELCAKPSRVSAFVELCRPYGIVEASRSGMMAMPRSPVSGYHDDDAEDEEEAGSKSGRVDATMLPPG